jgi:hypothetical protein
MQDGLIIILDTEAIHIHEIYSLKRVVTELDFLFQDKK